MKYCVKCGSQLMDEAVICPKCGCAANERAVKKIQTTKEAGTSLNEKLDATLAFVRNVLLIIGTLILLIGSYWGGGLFSGGLSNEGVIWLDISLYNVYGFGLSIACYVLATLCSIADLIVLCIGKTRNLQKLFKCITSILLCVGLLYVVITYSL